jgi:hypothetical protein
MRLQHLRTIRPGMAMMEVALVGFVAMPLAWALYWMTEEVVSGFHFVLGNAVGWPFL